jgi:serine/threonine protein kinase
MKLTFIVHKLLDITNVDLSQKDIYNNSILSLILEHLPDKSIINKILNKNSEDNEEEIKNIQEFKFTDFYQISEKGYQKGGYGQIYPVVNIKSNKTYILKKYHYFCEDNLICEDIIKEVLFLKRINKTYSSSFVKLFGFIQLQKSFYTVLNTLDLISYQYFKIISYTSDYKKYAKEFIFGCINSLYSLHCLGIIHSDLKTNNIMVKNNCVYIIDFGISFFAGFTLF